MIFSELYSAYYNTVAKILEALLNGEQDEKNLRKIVDENAFGESGMTVLPALKSGKWQVMHSDMTTPIRRIPTMPLTLLQKRWLKAISLDPRVKLFGVEFKGLDDVDHLFTEADYYVYDKYSDGDDYEDEGYIERFRMLLDAIKSKTPVEINSYTRFGNTARTKCMPVRLEYSAKDDKFRLIISGCRYMWTVNLGRVTDCRLLDVENKYMPKEKTAIMKSVTMKITNERNALERCLLHFAHFEKQVERLDKKEYSVSIKYDVNDELEMVIRVLSFGPNVEVIFPESFKELIVNKLKNQKELTEKNDGGN